MALSPMIRRATCKALKKGVTDALSENLLQAAFKVRTNHLFSFFNKKREFPIPQRCY